MNYKEAKEIVEKDVIEKLDGFSIVEESTIEFSSCFAFYYQNDTYSKTRHVMDMSVGAGAVLVSKESGEVFETGSAYSTEYYVSVFESCGDPFGEVTSTISVYGWEFGANKVAATKLIKAESGLNLRESKLIVDAVLNNESRSFTTESSEKAIEVANKLRNYGFRCKQLWSNQC
ncbi:hypothetical protein KO528_06100 [Saccharophagus degradans]|uniref:hypothetical protein n=1 Tax=Saccharophagus degradans TaxID=86304 RepID=UPI001C098CAD|nr:hypothetical protein [Saccharophagus degradans]MBU2984911.1 hypothetical protein [Saccharophagus degradans]